MASSYVDRLARIPLALARVGEMPEGQMRLDSLAAELSVSVDELRRDLLSSDAAESGAFLGLQRPYAIEFVDPEADDDDIDPRSAPIVRVIGRPDLGVENLSSGELALIYTAGRALLDAEPDNDDLRSALDVIATAMSGDSAEAVVTSDWTARLPLFHQAREQKRRLRIEYSSSWTPKVTERVIEPYHVLNTKHGWEIDAGPLGDDGDVRTFLLANVREVELLDDTFELPAQLDRVIARHRATTEVRMQIAGDARWAADLYAESVIAADEEGSTLDLALLPPVDRRVGLITLASGPDTRVLTREERLLTAGPRLAETLHRHHAI